MRINGAPLLPSLNGTGNYQLPAQRHRRRARPRSAPARPLFRQPQLQRRPAGELRSRPVRQQPRPAESAVASLGRQPLRPGDGRAGRRHLGRQHLLPGALRPGPAAHRRAQPAQTPSTSWPPTGRGSTAGTATALDVSQQEALVAGQRATLPSLRNTIEQNRIAPRHPGRPAAGAARRHRRLARDAAAAAGRARPAERAAGPAPRRRRGRGQLWWPRTPISAPPAPPSSPMSA